MMKHMDFLGSQIFKTRPEFQRPPRSLDDILTADEIWD